MLADGSSSVYGSDAVAGVVNFITRKKFDGLELHYQGQDERGSALGQYFSVLTGTSWDKGGVIGAFSYSYEGNLKNTSLWKTNPFVQPRACRQGRRHRHQWRYRLSGHLPCAVPPPCR